MRILVVDSDLASLFFVSALLTKQGHEPVPSRDGREAYRMICDRQASFVICAWNTPGLTGAQLCARIRSSDLPFYTYFILLSVRNDKEAMLQGLGAGADDFLVQPVDPDEFALRIRAGERILRLERELAERNTALNHLNAELSQAYETMRRDLTMAAAIQQSLLPKPESWPGARLEWLFLPSSVLAGDMIGYFPLDDAHLAFFQIDVSGHGVSSSLISFATSKQLWQRHREEIYGAAPRGNRSIGEPAFEPPDQVVADLNRKLATAPESDLHFLTMVYGVLDRTTRRLALSAAGHPPPLLWRASEATFFESQSRGIPVGVMECSQYETEFLCLDAGDRFFAYTDGIVECPDPAGEFFGTDRLKEVLSAAASRPISEIPSRVEHALRSWYGSDSYPDDISLLIVEV